MYEYLLYIYTHTHVSYVFGMICGSCVLRCEAGRVSALVPLAIGHEWMMVIVTSPALIDPSSEPIDANSEPFRRNDAN